MFLSSSAQVSGSRVFRFASLQPQRADRAVQPHQTRDAEAAMFIVSSLVGRGAQFAGLLPNLPDDQHAKDAGWSQRAMLGPRDLVVMGRPGMDDASDGVRDCLAPSHSWLERTLHASLREELAYCSRARVMVAARHVAHHPALGERWNVAFRQKNVDPLHRNDGAIQRCLRYGGRRWQEFPVSSHTSLAYLINRQTWRGGPRLHCSFAMSAESSLAWALILATRYPGLIASVPFAVAELTPPKRLPDRYTYDMAEQWTVRFLAGMGDAGFPP